MGAPSVTYEAPKIEKDDSFEKYLEYQKERETKLDERALKEKEDAAARDLTRRKSGAKGLTDLYGRTKGQLESGLVSFQGAQDRLQSYIDKYDLTGGFSPEDTGVEDNPDTDIDESKSVFNPGYTDPTKGANQYLTNLQNIYQGEGGILGKTA